MGAKTRSAGPYIQSIFDVKNDKDKRYSKEVMKKFIGFDEKNHPITYFTFAGTADQTDRADAGEVFL